jgi:threonylcarbamoyladenosine tRNA methylthiotransferase MtaB
VNVYLQTLGCRLNEAERESLARGFLAAGCAVVGRPEEAHVMVLNSCAVTVPAAKQSRQYARRLRRRNPRARLVVTGCYAELERERVANLAGVDQVVGNHDKDRLVELVIAEMPPSARSTMGKDPGDARPFPGSRTRAFVKVQDGCRNRCTFCVVTIARGQERSRPVEEVVEQIRALHTSGFQEAVLTGVHLGGYGSDRGTTLRQLVEAVLTRTRIPRLRLGSVEPWDLPEGFFELWSDPRLCPHLHLPMQSGSDSVLRRMARRCTSGRFRQLAAEARAAIPQLTLTTDLMVGFPQETEAEFAETLAFVGDLRFADVHVFTWSPRPETTAARLPGRVPQKVVRRRSRVLHEVAASSQEAHLRASIGVVRPVLWEGSGTPLPGGGRRWTGYTDTYLRAQTDVPAGVDLQNTITSGAPSAVIDGKVLVVPT